MKKNLNIKSSLIVLVTIWLTFAVVPPAVADNAVKLRLLVIATGAVAEDLGLAYIKPVLEEMGVPYDVLNAATHDLTPRPSPPRWPERTAKPRMRVAWATTTA